MVFSTNKKLNRLLKFIDSDTLDNMQLFVDEVVNREFVSFDTEEQVSNYLKDYVDNLDMNSNEIDSLRYYTGTAFNSINAILRGSWDYEKNGELTKEKQEKLIELINSMDEVMSKLPSYDNDFKTYRGVRLSSFRDYGISSLEELPNMIGQYYYQEAFTSTSLIRDRSFFDRELEWHNTCNIEIEYLIPRESNDAIPLITNELSYSNIQSELLINRGSLVKIVDVKLSEDKKKAYIKAVLVPQKIWNMSYEEKQTISK